MSGVIVVAAVAYLSGAIPFSYIAGHVFAGIDLRQHGSGNLGASNTFRFLGAKVAVVVLLADVAKGFWPVFFAPAIGGGAGVSDSWLVVIAAFFAVFGHMFSVFVKFRGGKGAATTAGAFLALAPVAFAVTFAVWLTVLLVTRIVSLASILGAIALPIAVFVTGRLGAGSYHWSQLVLALAITGIVIAKHRSNIKRLLAGQEPALQRHKING